MSQNRTFLSVCVAPQLQVQPFHADDPDDDDDHHHHDGGGDADLRKHWDDADARARQWLPEFKEQCPEFCKIVGVLPDTARHDGIPAWAARREGPRIWDRPSRTSTWDPKYHVFSECESVPGLALEIRAHLLRVPGLAFEKAWEQWSADKKVCGCTMCAQWPPW